MIRLIALPLLLLPSLFPPPSLCYTWPSIESERPEDCARKGEAFDSIALRCVDCSDAAEPTRDGLGCRCRDGFRVLQVNTSEEMFFSSNSILYTLVGHGKLRCGQGR